MQKYICIFMKNDNFKISSFMETYTLYNVANSEWRWNKNSLLIALTQCIQHTTQHNHNNSYSVQHRKNGYALKICSFQFFMKFTQFFISFLNFLCVSITLYSATI